MSSKNDYRGGKKNLPQKKRMSQINKMVRKGTTLAELKRVTGLTESTLETYLYKLGISPIENKCFKGEYKGEKVRRIVREGLAKNPCSIEDICNKARIKPLSFWKICQTQGWEIPEDAKPYKNYPTLDRMIEEGQTLEAMGKRIHTTREYVRQYLNATNQHIRWRAIREKPKRTVRIAKELAGIIRAEQLRRAEQVTDIAHKNWALMRAWEYRARSHHYSEDDLYRLFRAYQKARLAGKTMTYEELGSAIDVPFTSVRGILSRSGIASMRGYNRHKSVTNAQRRLVNHARRLKMSAMDIGFFTGTNSWFVKGNSNRSERSYLSNLGWHKVSYRVASQVYEAEDLGFSFEDMKELFDLNQAKLITILGNRDLFEPRIISKLQAIYKDKGIKSPYLSRSQRRLWQKV